MHVSYGWQTHIAQLAYKKKRRTLLSIISLSLWLALCIHMVPKIQKNEAFQLLFYFLFFLSHTHTIVQLYVFIKQMNHFTLTRNRHTTSKINSTIEEIWWVDHKRNKNIHKERQNDQLSSELHRELVKKHWDEIKLSSNSNERIWVLCVNNKKKEYL